MQQHQYQQQKQQCIPDEDRVVQHNQSLSRVKDQVSHYEFFWSLFFQVKYLTPKYLKADFPVKIIAYHEHNLKSKN